MRLVIKLDFSTSEIALELGKVAFEKDLEKLYVSVHALKVWNKQAPPGRNDLLLCDVPGPREITAIAKHIYEALRLRPIFFRNNRTNNISGFRAP